MSVGWFIFFGLTSWISVVAGLRLCALPWLAKGPDGDWLVGLLWRIARLYCRVRHRARYLGFEELRSQLKPGPLIVVSNHTGSVDPLLIQSGCRFGVRWMMASEMITPSLSFLWRRIQPIPVNRDGRDLASAREAIRHLKAGGVVGIFPEGRIVAPPKQIRPFHSGVGLIVARSQAPVLLVWISGTPETSSLIGSMLRPSHARVEFIKLIDFKGETDATVITDRLRNDLAKASGWPLNDEPQPLT